MLNLKKVITRGVIDMATSRVLETDFHYYRGPWARADAASTKALQDAIKLELEAHARKVSEAITAVTDQVKTFGAIQEGGKAAIEKLNADGQKIIEDHGKLKTEHATVQARILDLEQKLISRGPGGAGNVVKSLGEQVVDSVEWKEYAKRASSLKGSMNPFRFKTITSLTGSGGPGLFPQILPTVVVQPLQPLTMRDLLDVSTTENSSIEWVFEKVFTNMAGMQSEGGLKPESNITYDREIINVKTIAHWIKASKQILSDFKQLPGLINGRLTYGLKLKEEQQILFGDGTGDNLHGLVPQSTAYSNIGGHSTDTRIDVIRRAMLQVMLAFYNPTGIVMSPTDWMQLELLKDTLGRYLIASPTQSSPGFLWGLPVVQAFSFVPGDFLVGAFKLAATLFDREESQILVSNEDQDNFVRNLVTILCEERLALGVSRSQALVYGSIPSGESTN